MNAQVNVRVDACGSGCVREVFCVCVLRKCGYACLCVCMPVLFSNDATPDWLIPYTRVGMSI